MAAKKRAKKAGTKKRAKKSGSKKPTKASRSRAAKKAAATRKRNHAKHVAAGKKGARAAKAGKRKAGKRKAGKRKARGMAKGKATKGTIVVKNAVKRAPGTMYFVDKAGNLRATKLNKKGAKKHHKVCKKT